ncbi:malonate--CoA ligase ACSF3, mitochondrial-like [Macrosteles quadrilineatus]|uniref:malonate--CoA ligase ACSF3, mitochondrial-like n=1 Tax=Macrosteles quadrilineatus TaxID=74068 RepID=UPI0023E1F20B|nr:malonate--CoA ligase ACSF3, mitochondrial-like [Macrosteles quadrilineatus]
MLFLLTILSSGRQTSGNVTFRKGLRELQKLYQHTSTVPINKTFRDGRFSKHVKFDQPVYKYAALHGEKSALRDKHGEYSYSGLLDSSTKFAEVIRNAVEGKSDERVVFLCPNDASYVVTQWACWIGGQTAVPLSRHFPPPMMEYFVNDCDAKLIVTTPQYSKTMTQLAEKTNKRLVVLDDVFRIEAMAQKSENEDNIVHSDINGLRNDLSAENKHNNDKAALILYTSGSTGPPKGVVLTHRNLQAQVSSQVEAWQWTSGDVVLHSLPLHHIHGVVNALLTPFMVGAKCVMHSAFNPSEVWNEFLGKKEGSTDRISVFMGVPTMYINLLNEYDQSLTKNERMVEYVKATCSEKIRLMVSGSAPLPSQVFDWWQMVTGHEILERYGMTEIGMALSNPLHGERKPGFVGSPMPGVRVRIVQQNDIPSQTDEVLCEGDNIKTRNFTNDSAVSGLLQVKGEGVFSQYWNKPESTATDFTSDGWFKTGDIAEYIEGSYRILGRSSVDIIKTGGYKVSALQIEYVLLNHPDIIDVAVVGLPDITWGQKIAAVVQLKEGSSLDLKQVQHFVKERLPVYMMPSMLKVVDSIPRNALGKVNKKEIVTNLFNRTAV